MADRPNGIQSPSRPSLAHHTLLRAMNWTGGSVRDARRDRGKRTPRPHAPRRRPARPPPATWMLAFAREEEERIARAREKATTSGSHGPVERGDVEVLDRDGVDLVGERHEDERGHDLHVTAEQEELPTDQVASTSECLQERSKTDRLE
ncbi:MAG: hypothetical protein M1823_006059 [Watsoniomyces obsoletus]|nr:MAG: hypothetical protein M1823_006059 [Watsoniomyces obsoletus]